MNSELPDELIAKKLSGNISEQEDAMLSKWLGEARENAGAFEKAQQAWGLTLQHTVVADTDAAWNKLKGAINAEQQSGVVKVRSMQQVWRIAAAIVLIVGVGFLFNTFLNQPQLKTIASADKPIKVELPDKSVAWLNRNSQVTFDEKFKGNKREVKLQGEAFFEVVHNEKQPFIITANNTVTEDIGTSFNIRAIKGEGQVEVTVATGEVALSEAGDKSKIYLMPGDKGVFEAATHRLSSIKNNDPNFMAWQTNKLVFDKNSLSEVAATLGKYYNIDFEVNSDAAQILFTGTFDHASIEDAIRILETSTGTQITRQTKGYSISIK